MCALAPAAGPERSVPHELSGRRASGAGPGDRKTDVPWGATSHPASPRASSRVADKSALTSAVTVSPSDVLGMSGGRISAGLAG